MIEFKLGSNFDINLISQIKNLNDQYKEQNRNITEFYGSTRDQAYLAARPDFRLPDVSRKNFEKYIKASLDANINFNYTMNTINPGSKQELLIKKDEIQDFVKYLEEVGVNRITVANPILLDIIREVSNINLEVSTVAHIDAITQIKAYKEYYNVDKVCANLYKNRDIKWLTRAASWCNTNDVKLELMVNEFCCTGGKDFATNCFFRDSCYMVHASSHTKEDALSLNGYPMSYCMTSRKTDPANWLRARWVRPEDIQKYVNIGINNFKITGRTGSTEYITTMCKAYLSGQHKGNLLMLWKSLETIYSGENELTFNQPTDIDNSLLDGFVDYWFNNLSFSCEDVVCGEDCTYCHDYYNKKIEGGK